MSPSSRAPAVDTLVAVDTAAHGAVVGGTPCPASAALRGHKRTRSVDVAGDDGAAATGAAGDHEGACARRVAHNTHTVRVEGKGES